MVGTFWAFIPAIVAIALALITKRVYVSLFAGIFLGAMFLASGNPILALGRIFELMSGALGNNGGILIFLVMLGVLVVLMTRSGGSTAYGEWASTKIKSRKGAMFAAAGLGVLIFVDDYFNCLTVGNAMRPVTDKFRISRAKLAYIIDATAAPICIIAPISSWAAAVSGQIEGNGLMMFIRTIPFNLYAILTLVMVFAICFFKFDFGKMRRNEQNAEATGDLFSGETDLPSEDVSGYKTKNGKVISMLLPVLVLIVSCIGSMIYTGYFYDWDIGALGTTALSSSVIEAFSNCEAGLSLAIGSTIAVIFTFIYYMLSGSMNIKELGSSLVDGFKSMVPAILILTLAWTISAVMGDNGLNASEYVENVLSQSSLIAGLIPAIFFLIAALISFSTGTSWGTFGILIPIALALIGNTPTVPVFIAVSAILAGSVVGDHCSPISDTTILSSSGAQCNHIDHVKTQMPYVMLVTAVCLISYIICGFVGQAGLSYGITALIAISVGLILLVITLITVHFLTKRSDAHRKENKNI